MQRLRREKIQKWKYYEETFSSVLENFFVLVVRQMQVPFSD